MGHFLWCTAVFPHLSDSSYNVAQKKQTEIVSSQTDCELFNHFTMERKLYASALTEGQLEE